MAKLKVMCARSMHLVVIALGREFALAARHDIAFDFGTVGALQGKLDAGETADVLILSTGMIDRLDEAGALVPGSRRAVARTFIGVAVKEGAPKPDLATAEAFEALIRNAKAFAHSDPGVGGSAGVHLAREFEQRGLADIVKAKGSPQSSGVEVAKRVVEGAAEFGLTLSGEIASVPGAAIAGAVPAPYGLDTAYAAGVSAGSGATDAAAALIAALTAPGTYEQWRRAGFGVG